MQLQDKPFRQIKSGEKDIELRLFDEKRQKIKTGDIITFSNKETKEIVTCGVVRITRAVIFSELFEGSITKERAGFGREDDIDELMSGYYSSDKIAQYGAVGIVIKLVK